MLKNFFIFAFVFCPLLFLSCRNNGEAEMLYVKATGFYAKQELESAEECADQALKKDSDFYQAALLKAKILYFKDENGAAEKILTRTIKKHPQFVEARLWKIRVLLALEKFSDCETLIKNELSFNQTDWRLYYLYSILASKMGQMDKRLSMCRKANDILQDTEKVYIESADLWLLLGMRDHALDELDTAEIISADPESIRLLKGWLKDGKDIR